MERILIRSQDLLQDIPAEVSDDQIGVGYTAVVLSADAQATIAALQARVQELEAIKIPDDAFTYCAYCGEKSPVDEHNEDLSAHIKVCPKHPMRDVEDQLTQRTAELERVRALIKALPKVEGEIVAQAGYVKDRKKVYACFGSDADMTAYAALLTHRQGMEG